MSIMEIKGFQLLKRQSYGAALQRSPDWRKMKQTNKKTPVKQTNVMLLDLIQLINCSP